jgi:hydroxymethylbilane synthase
VLAHAGLKRLGLTDRVTQRLDIVPAAGQGAIGIECRENDDKILKIISPLNDDLTFRVVGLERDFLKMVNGSCQTPVGCHVEGLSGEPQKFVMRCFLSKTDGSDYFEKTVTGLWEEGPELLKNILPT